MNGERRSYRARWLLPVDGEPIENATVEIQDGLVTGIHAVHDPRAEDLGNVALIPGLVNVHTHLEFSDLQKPLSATAEPGSVNPEPASQRPALSAAPFADWIRAVVALRNARRSEPWPIITRGLQESTQAGCTTLGEIATTDWPTGRVTRPESAKGEDSESHALPSGQGVPPGESPRLVVFRELIGPLPEHIQPQLETACRHFMQSGERRAGSGEPEEILRIRASGSRLSALCSPPLIRGLSPHAPYSVHFELFHKLVKLAVESRAPLAIHLAETQAELEYLNHGGGELARLRKEFGIGPEHAVPRETRPLDFLSPLKDLDRALIIHGNYLSEDELDFVAAHPNLAVVYCPRTHAYFGHREHPWRKLLQKGAAVALGTDSRASNPDLSLWRELCFLKDRYPDVDPQTLLKLGTLDGARALGLEEETGSLTVGKSADLTLVSLTAPQKSDPVPRLLDGRQRIVATMRSGRWLEATRFED